MSDLNSDNLLELHGAAGLALQYEAEDSLGDDRQLLQQLLPLTVNGGLAHPRRRGEMEGFVRIKFIQDFIRFKLFKKYGCRREKIKW